VNGTVRPTNKMEDMKLIGIGISQSDRLYKNKVKGFEEVSAISGITGNNPKEGLAVADYNNDGYEDVLAAGSYKIRDSISRLYENNGSGNNWLTIKLIGTKSNRDSIGAKIKIRYNGDQVQFRQIISGDSFLSQSSLWQTFGLGKSEWVDEIEIKWPSGTVKKLYKIKSNQQIVINE
jgi:hypothetical protein